MKGYTRYMSKSTKPAQPILNKFTNIQWHNIRNGMAWCPACGAEKKVCWWLMADLTNDKYKKTPWWICEDCLGDKLRKRGIVW